jgi:hypothetical protein
LAVHGRFFRYADEHARQRCGSFYRPSRLSTLRTSSETGLARSLAQPDRARESAWSNSSKPPFASLRICHSGYSWGRVPGRAVATQEHLDDSRCATLLSAPPSSAHPTPLIGFVHSLVGLGTCKTVPVLSTSPCHQLSSFTTRSDGLFALRRRGTPQAEASTKKCGALSSCPAALTAGGPHHLISCSFLQQCACYNNGRQDLFPLLAGSLPEAGAGGGSECCGTF